MSLTEQTKKWIRKNCLKSFEGKTVVITGANSGVGFKEAETLVFLGAKVIMACRNLQKAENARNILLSEYPGAVIQIMELNIADFSSINKFVQEVINQSLKIDMFINNAGIFHMTHQKTKDGFELVLGTNYLGTYQLTEKILPYLEQTGYPVKYVNTVSVIHKIGSVKYDDFYFSKKYNNFLVYARSKLCLAKYTWYISQKYKKSTVQVLMNHPGITITPLGVNAFGSFIGKLADFAKFIFNSPEKSALSAALILSRDFESGSIVGPGKLFGGWGYPKLNHISPKVKTGGKELVEFTESECKQLGIFKN